MPFSKCDPGVLAELDGHWLECNYPKLERLARRQRRQQRLSEGSDGSSVSSPLPPLDLINSGILAMEHFFLAECEFQSRYLLASLDEIIGEMQPPRFPSNSLDRAIHEARRGLKEASPQERIYLTCMLGKLLVFQGRYEEALSEAFSGGSQMVEEEINSLLHLDTGGSIDDGEGRRDRTLDDLVPPDETGTVVGATSLTASSNGGDQGGSAPSLSGPFRLPSAVALQTLLCLGLALEQMGRAKDALLPYSDVTGHCRRLPNRDRLLNSTGLSFFVGLAMYRYGMLCSALAIDPRSLQGTGPFTSAASTGQLREQLLSDAALSLRMFLSFKPRIFGSLRHRAAATSYWEVLEARFRQISYRKAFACSTARLEHGPMMMQATTTIPSRDLAVSMALEINGPFCPGSYAEDMLLGVQLMEALTPLPTDAEGAQKGGLSRTVQVSIARLARREDWPGLASYCQGLLIKYAADATAYGRLVLANAAAGRLAEVIRAGEIYVDLGGIEPSTLLIIARANMLLPGRASHAVRILERQLGRAIAVSATSGHGDGSGGHSSHIHSPPSPHTEPTKEGGEGTGKGTEHRSPPTSLGNALRVTLGAAYLRCAMVAGCSQAHSRDLIEQAVTILAEAVIQDETDARPHYWLALAYALQRRLRPAEDCIKTALSLESEMPVAWFLFALIASARKDYDLCLSICNSYQEGHPVLFIPICLIKLTLLSYLGLHEEALQLATQLISMYTDPAGPVANDLSSMSAIKFEESTMPWIPPDPAQFRARFYPPREQSITSTEDSCVTGIAPAQRLGLTMSEYKGSFPAPLSRTVLGRLGTERSESGVGGIGGAGSGSPAFPESFISSVEQVALLRARSILEGGKSPLLTSFLWVTLGRLYLQQHQQFIVDEDQPGQQQQPQQQRSLSLAELCGHEALLTTELCPEVYTLKGEILLRVPGESSSQEAPALEAFRLALHMGPPRGAALRGMAQVYMREPGSDRPRLLLALQAAQEALRDYVHDTAALALAADLCRRLSMDKLGEEYFSRALQLEETDPILPWASVIDLFYTSLS